MKKRIILIATCLFTLYCHSTNAQTNSLTPYCEPVFGRGATFNNYISNVTIGTINNTTKKLNNKTTAYYKNITPVKIKKGEPTSMNVSVVKTDGELNCIDVFVDFNGDGKFVKKERIGGPKYADVFAAKGGGATTKFSFNITIPKTASVTGNTRIRVVFTDANSDITTHLPKSTSNPCHDYNKPLTGDTGWDYGEVEDYIVNVEKNGTTRVNGLSVNNNISIYPNPTDDFININCSECQKGLRVILYSSIGLKVLDEKFENMKIDITHLPKGVYFLSFKDKDNSFVLTKTPTKLVIK